MNVNRLLGIVATITAVSYALIYLWVSSMPHDSGGGLLLLVLLMTYAMTAGPTTAISVLVCVATRKGANLGLLIGLSTGFVLTLCTMVKILFLH
jgi:hypothetical protein